MHEVLICRCALIGQLLQRISAGMVKPVDEQKRNEQKETKTPGHATPFSMKIRYSNGICIFAFSEHNSQSRRGRSQQLKKLNTREIDANQTGGLRSTVTQ